MTVELSLKKTLERRWSGGREGDGEGNSKLGEQHMQRCGNGRPNQGNLRKRWPGKLESMLENSGRLIAGQGGERLWAIKRGSVLSWAI